MTISANISTGQENSAARHRVLPAPPVLQVTPARPLARSEPRAVPRLPGAARLIVLPAGATVSVETRCRSYAQIGRASVLGPTSRAATLWVHGPAPIEVELDALAWSRLTTIAANTLTDRLVPASMLNIDPPETTSCAALARALGASTGPDRQTMPSDAIVGTFAAIVQRFETADVATVADTLGVHAHLLRRLTLRHFGFPPKLLLVRARFLAAFAAFRQSGMRFDSVLEFGYFDSSHFLRDANRFLGTTPRRYLERFAALMPLDAGHLLAA